MITDSEESGDTEGGKSRREDIMHRPKWKGKKLANIRKLLVTVRFVNVTDSILFMIYKFKTFHTLFT
jgi:hypothetical protein